MRGHRGLADLRERAARTKPVDGREAATVASSAVDTRFSPDAWERLVCLPPWLFLHVAGADGPIDPRAAACFDQHIVTRSIGVMPTAAPLLKALYREVASRGISETIAACRSLGARGAADFESAQQDLRATLRPEEYEAFTVELLGDAASVASAPTGSVGPKAAAALGGALRVLDLPLSPARASSASDAVVAPDWLHPGAAAELMDGRWPTREVALDDAGLALRVPASWEHRALGDGGRHLFERDLVEALSVERATLPVDVGALASWHVGEARASVFGVVAALGAVGTNVRSATELMGFATGRGESSPRLRAWRRREALVAGSPGLCARLGADEVSLAELDFEYTSKLAGDGDGRLLSLAARRGGAVWRVVFSARARLGAAVKLTPRRCAAATFGALRIVGATPEGA